MCFILVASRRRWSRDTRPVLWAPTFSAHTRSLPQSSRIEGAIVEGSLVAERCCARYSWSVFSAKSTNRMKALKHCLYRGRVGCWAMAVSNSGVNVVRTAPEVEVGVVEPAPLGLALEGGFQAVVSSADCT